MIDVMNIRALSVSQKEGKYMVHVQPSHASEMSQWSHELRHQGFVVPYKGQTHASYGFQVLKEVVARQMKSTRGVLSMDTRCLVKERQGNFCSSCGEDRMLELDQIKPLRLGGADDLSNVHAICTACHLTETNQEELLGKVNYGPLVSVLNSHVHGSFHLNIKTPQCVLPLSELKGYAVEIDAVRSRRNALYQNEHPFSSLQRL